MPYCSGNMEPTVEELLNDPIAALMRQSDKLTLENVLACLKEASWRPEGGLSPMDDATD